MQDRITVMPVIVNFVSVIYNVHQQIIYTNDSLGFFCQRQKKNYNKINQPFFLYLESQVLVLFLYIFCKWKNPKKFFTEKKL